MALDPSVVKKQVQDHLQEGLLLVVGTGPSIAEGIPGMSELALHLREAIPAKLVSQPDPGWDDVVSSLEQGNHLEHAMGKATLLPATVEAIVDETARLIAGRERLVFQRVLAGQRTLPLTSLMRHLFKAARRFHLITTNYDRLAELAAEASGVGVDSRFFGYLHGRHEPKRSADAHRESYISGKTSAFRSLPCLSVYKPHGSLDWYDIDGKIVRCPIDCNRVPIIITPGTSKYKESFKWAFDDQRTAGNRAATSSTRLMFIGYGFNDDHLEQYLCPGLRLTKPTLIVTKTLSPNALALIRNSSQVQVLALCADSSTDTRTHVVSSTGEDIVVSERLWDLEGFNKGVI